MSKIDKQIAFVKEHVAIQQKLAKKYEDSPFRRGQHLDSAKGFLELEEFLNEIKSKGTDNTAYLHRDDSPKKRLNLTHEDVEGLPDELLKELNLTDADRQDLAVEHLIAQAGGVLPLDKIMIELYRRTHEVPKRNTLTSRLYRMVGKGMIYNVPGKKGVYTTYEMSEDQAKRMFGVDGDGEESAAAAPSQPTTGTAAPLKTALTAGPDDFKRRFLSSASTVAPRK